MTNSSPLMIDCGAHGRCVAAVVCGHMIQSKDRSVGFIENSSDPSDLQAWCDECEKMFLHEGDKTETFLAFNQMAVVCDRCYAELKNKHMAGVA